MSIVKRLIEETDDAGSMAQNAAIELVSVGASSVTDIVEAIRLGRGSTMLLREVLLQIHDPDVVTILSNFVQDENITLSAIAIDVLGQSRDLRALKPLLNLLPTWRKNMAVDALGELGNSEAIPYLQHMAREILDDPLVAQAMGGELGEGCEEFDGDCLRLLINIIIALAKLGNCELASLIFPLTQYDLDCDSNAFFIRKEAVRALQYVVVAGMLPVLRLSLSDEDAEVRSSAIDALFYLGLKESIDLIVPCVHDKNYNVFSHAMMRLHDLTGHFVEDKEPDELELWWQEHQKVYNLGICYRLGRPLFLPDVIELLADSNYVGSILKELKIVTGHDFGFSVDIPICTHDELLERVRQWWHVEGSHLEPGALYKYGRKQNIKEIC